MKGAVATIGGMGANAREYAHMMFSDAKDKVGGAARSSQKVSLVDFPGLSENVAAQVQPGVLAKIPPELRKYAGQVTIGSRDASDRAEGVQQLGETFSDMKRSGKIVAPEDPTRPYMPANKLKDGTILWHPDAVIHGHVMDLAGGGEFAGRRKDVVSSGGIAPSGEYYDQGTIGDINERWTAAVRSLKKVDEPVSFIKAAEQRLVGGLVYEPNVVDGQGDYVPTAVEIWKGIETWAESGHTIKFMHDGRPLRGKVLPVEIFQAEKDTHKGGGIIPAGAWYLCCKVLDDKLWAACKSGEITGFSMSGSALASVEKMGVFEGRADAAASSGKAAVEKAGEGNPNHDELGRFAEGDSSGGLGEFVTLGKDATGHHTHDDPAIQERIKSLVLPPAWTNVKLSADPKAELQAVGTDSKGRQQYVYSAEHSAKASAEKFERLKQFTAELPAIRSRRENDLNRPTSPHHDDATALYLIDKTGFRIGGSKDTQADQHAYGASTLTADHVKIDGDKVAFDFIGKHGVRIQQEVEDSRLASLLAPKLARGGRLFDTDDNRLRGYLHSIDGEFKVKDFRTLKAAETALTTMRGMAAPTDMKSYKAQRNAVGDAVAAKLGNTRTVALSSYIPPEVFSKWKI
jgi:DNA topoisomerase-1